MPCFCYVLFVELLLNWVIHHFLETNETEVGYWIVIIELLMSKSTLQDENYHFDFNVIQMIVISTGHVIRVCPLGVFQIFSPFGPKQTRNFIDSPPLITKLYFQLEIEKLLHHTPILSWAAVGVQRLSLSVGPNQSDWCIRIAA